ncbi:hypothetical protein ACFL1V_01460 [Pseudomonadota bacterium]
MSLLRRKFLQHLTAIIAGLPFAAKAVAQESPKRTALGYTLHDDVSLSLLETYARSLALKDADARWQAQLMFHQAQVARQGGGTMGHTLGYKHKAFVEEQEQKDDEVQTAFTAADRYRITAGSNER